MTLKRTFFVLVFAIFTLFILRYKSNDSLINQQSDSPRPTQLKQLQNQVLERKIAAVDFTEKKITDEIKPISKQKVLKRFQPSRLISFRPPDQQSILWQQKLISNHQINFKDSDWSFFSNTIVERSDDNEKLNRLHQSGNYLWILEPYQLQEIDFKDKYPALYNSKTRKLGIMNGNLIIKLKNNVNPSDLIFEYKINLKYQMNNLAIYSLSDKTSPLEVQMNLKNDPRIENFYFEITDQDIGLIQ